jgi:hypothetical protein
MKIVLLGIVAFLLTAGTALAHTPSAIRLTYDNGGLLEVAVDHDSEDPAIHYIERIEVTVNGDKKEFYFKAQTDRLGLYQKLLIPVKTNPEITATAYCNVMGAASVTLGNAEPVRKTDIR